MIKFVVCVPTELELKLLAPRIGQHPACCVEVIGFGPVTATARTAWLIAEFQPERMFLLGISGAYGSDLPIGSAAQFQKVASYGVGVGTGAMHRSAFDVGFPQTQTLLPAGKHARSDILPLDFSAFHPSAEMLLSVCASAADPVDVDLRLEQFPSASAEDMEGFGFAFACHQADVPAQIIRGISNIAGERNRALWRIEDAVDSAAKLFADVFDAVLC